MRLMFYILFFVTASKLCAQIEGEVSFISSQHYYVRFEKTEGMSENDTLYFQNSHPVLLIKYISERSCACMLIGEKVVSKGDKVFGKIKKNKKAVTNPVHNNSLSRKSINIINKRPGNNAIVQSSQVNFNQVNYHGRLSIQNYNTYTNTGLEFQRSRYSLSGKVENIAQVFTFSAYLHYSKNENFFRFNGGKRLNIYDLNLNYHPDNKFDLWVGRYLNRRISSINSVDGLQAEKKSGNYFMGLLAGSRPDFGNMGYNIKLLEYGAYAGRTDTFSKGLMESTLGFLQQTNNSAIDRRFIYLQHQNSILSNLNFFVSSEIDLYTREEGKGQNNLSITSIYFHSRYSPLKELSFNFSYDARKNVIYCETFRNIADSILDKETRQGARLGINIRPFTKASFGINAGYRYKKGDSKPTRNINAHFSYSSIPLIGVSGSINFTKLITSHLDGLTYGINLSKQMFSSLSTTLNLRRVNYSFTRSDMRQNILSSDITFRLSKMFFLVGGYEVIFEKKSTNQRILFDITARL